MKDEHQYSLRTISRIFKTLPLEAQQRLWMDMSSVMESYAQNKRQEYELISIGELDDEIKDRLKNFGKVIGLKSGYTKFDLMTKGFVEGEMTVIGGVMSAGKSLFAANIAYNIVRNGNPVVFITLEMSHAEIGSRIAKIHQVASNDPWAETKDLPIYFQKYTEVSWQSIDGLVERALEKDCKICFIDYLQYFPRNPNPREADAEIALISREVKKNAIKHKIPIVLISQVRKAGGSSSDKRRVLDNEDLMGTAAIGYDADIVAFVEKVKKSDPAYLDNADSYMVKVTKNRNRGVPNYRSQYVFQDFRLKEYGVIDND